MTNLLRIHTVYLGLAAAIAAIVVFGLVSGGFGQATSGDTVSAQGIETQACVPPPAGLVSWWPGDGHTDDITDDNPGVLMNGAAFGTGMVDQAFSLDGVNDLVEVPDSPNLKISGSITIDAWISHDIGLESVAVILSKYESDSAGGGVAYLLALRDADTPDVFVRFVVYENKDGSVRRALDTEIGVVPTGVFTHIAGTFDLATQEMKIYVNGTSTPATIIPGSTTITSIFPSTSPVRIGAFRTINSAVVGYFPGLIDEVEIFDRSLSGTEIQAIFDAGSEGKCKPGAEPVPTLSQWGLIALAALLAVAVAWRIRRRATRQLA